jgi:hypothetical protein
MHPLAYISAASHSGSTLLAMLLNAHPGACTVGELKATSLGDPTRYRCSCGQFLSECPFWKEVRDGMAQRGIDYDPARAGTSIHAVDSRYAARLLAPLHRGPALEIVRDAALALSPAWRRHLTETRQRNATLVATLQDITGANVIVDSSKTGLRLKYLLTNPDLDIHVIRLVRDGRGVALTYVNPLEFADATDPALRAGGSGGTRENEEKPMADAAREWRRSNEEAEQVVRCLPNSRCIRVRYEDLCATPDATLERIFTFLALNPGERAQNFRNVEHHVLGNGMRLDSTSEIRLDDRWKTRLTPEQLAVFDAEAGELNRRYGYN